jgi:predicted phage terminase large subunit-like protein
VDDLENDEHVLTKYQRDKLDRWFSSALLPALAGNAELHFLGTPLHHDALLRRLQERGGFKSRRYPAVKTSETCPTCEDDPDLRFNASTETPCATCHGAGRVYETTWGYRGQEYLGKMRLAMGQASFSRELLLVVTDEERKRFPRALFRYDDRPAPEGTSVRIPVDVGLGQDADSDRSAVAVVMRRKGERRYHVADVWAGRVRGTKLLTRVKDVYQEYRDLGYAPTVVFESVQAQVWGAQALEDEGIPVSPVKPNKDKLTRAEPVSVHYENGRVSHAAHLRDGDAEDELDQFPDGEHDDIVDAIVYGVMDLEGDSHGGVAGAVQHGKKAREARKGKERPDPRNADD